MVFTDRTKLIKKYFSYTFKDSDLLKLALKHASTKSNSHTQLSNERLEFLGDAVLGLVISELLYKRFPLKQEGELTLYKSELVSRKFLAQKAQPIMLDKIIELGAGLKEKDRIPTSVLANGFEAVLGAIYLEGGMTAAKRSIRQLFLEDLEIGKLPKAEHNYKAMLQHYSQKQLGTLPDYKVIKRTGLHHAPTFTLMVKIGKKEYGPAEGRTVKIAEQNVAQQAIEILKKQN